MVLCVLPNELVTDILEILWKNENYDTVFKYGMTSKRSWTLVKDVFHGRLVNLFMKSLKPSFNGFLVLDKVEGGATIKPISYHSSKHSATNVPEPSSMSVTRVVIEMGKYYNPYCTYGNARARRCFDSWWDSFARD